MRVALAAVLLGALPAGAAEFTSAYSELDRANCTVLAEAPSDGEGEWRNLFCVGHAGTPVFLSESDGRESVFFGVPPAGADGLGWESFSAFNHLGPTVEWRMTKAGGAPFAAIYRVAVSDPEDDGKKTEVLVVETVGRPDRREGCAVALVMATGVPGANETARRIADAQALDFACGADQPATVSDDLLMPEWTGGQ